MKKLIFEFNETDIIEFNNCLCCGSKNLKLISRAISPSKGGRKTPFLETSFCNECGHIQRNKILSEEWMLKMFDYRDSFQVSNSFNPINPKVERYRYDRYKLIGEKIIEIENLFLSSDKNIVDIGCGPGTGLEAWRDLGLRPVGIEPDISRAKIGLKKGLHIQNVAWEDIDINDFKDPIFTSIQSLEHFYKPKDFLLYIANLMTLKSSLYVEVPDTKEFVKDWNDSIYLGHVNNFSDNSLRLLLEQVGLNNIQRVYPYDSMIENEQNLCFIAKKDPLNEFLNQKCRKKEVDDYINSKIEDYIKGLPSNDPSKYENNFHLNYLNDLMFSYKRESSVKETIKDHNKLRDIKYLDKDNYYIH